MIGGPDWPVRMGEWSRDVLEGPAAISQQKVILQINKQYSNDYLENIRRTDKTTNDDSKLCDDVTIFSR